MLSIVIPDDVKLLEPPPAAFDDLAARLTQSPQRSCLFFEESVAVYVLQSCDDGQQPPPELHATVSWATARQQGIPQSPTLDGDPSAHTTAFKVSDLLMTGTSEILGHDKLAAIWRFSLEVSNPLRTPTGLIRLAVFLNNPHRHAMSVNVANHVGIRRQSHTEEPPEAQPCVAPHNLLDQLNHLVSVHSGPRFELSLGQHKPSANGGQLRGHRTSLAKEGDATKVLAALGPGKDTGSNGKREDETSEPSETSETSDKTSNKLETSESSGESCDVSCDKSSGDTSTKNETKPSITTASATSDGEGDECAVTGLRTPMNPPDSAVLDLDTASPLVLKLKSVKPVGRNDILISMLSIEASDKVATLAAREAHPLYQIQVSSVTATLKGAKVVLLGPPVQPRLLAVTDTWCLSYKIEDMDRFGWSPSQADAALTNGPGNSAYGGDSAPIKPLPASAKGATKMALPELPSAKVLEVSIELQVTRQLSASGGRVTVVRQTVHAGLPVSDMASSLPYNRAALPQARRAATTMETAKKSVTINNVVSYGHSSPSERYSSATLSSPTLVPTKGLGKRKAQMSLGSLSTHNSSVTVNISSTMPLPLNGLALTFTGDFSMGVGHVVTWKVQVVNKASRPLQASLQFRDSRTMGAGGPGSAPYVRGSHSTVSLSQAAGGDDDKKVLGQMQLVHQYLRHRAERPGVMLLSSDIIIGHLDVNQVHETELKLMGLSKGVHGLWGLRLVEMSGDTVDFGRLLEVFVT